MRLFRILIVLLLPGALVLGAEVPRDVTPESVLADQVRAIASSRGSTKEKQRAIASAVKFAILAATADLKDPAQILEEALLFSNAAAKAAPGFVDAIISGASSIPAIEDIDGAIPELQTEVAETAKDSSGEGGDTGQPSSPRPGTNSGFGGSTGDVIVSPTT